LRSLGLTTIRVQLRPCAAGAPAFCGARVRFWHGRPSVATVLAGSEILHTTKRPRNVILPARVRGWKERSLQWQGRHEQKIGASERLIDASRGNSEMKRAASAAGSATAEVS
jgi:hypothetical protein